STSRRTRSSTCCGLGTVGTGILLGPNAAAAPLRPPLRPRRIPVPTVPNPQQVLDRVRRDVERNALRARNGIKLVAGVDRPGVGQTPKDVVWERGRCQLWHYRNEDVRYSPPLLIVFSMISRSYILDLTPGNSFIEQLLDAGFDVYMVDWGEPDERDARNRLEDYADDYIPAAVARVLEISGCD